MIILNTDHVNAFQYRNSEAARRLEEKLKDAGDAAATTIITVEEHMRGWLADIRRMRKPLQQIVPYRRLAHLFQFYSSWEILVLDEAAAEEFTRLQKLGIRVGSMDLKIASIAKVASALLLSRNLSDFRKVPELMVEDWLGSS
ncbi:MAG: type II toxin-antitoxin system VapC family toxin [Planctomycetota bacterium]|jgi:tRNA(fMet)-specific endonuclease VapC|nr:type II toxin-antitoxin system VapC family toxin [Planctomycetota bacterium]MDP7134531.1 type II toxin-antitoxin system VapC family toxin [Planctomycetota bacterium]MDP7251887.1 type II toxin-antitoxin system VapC family toxin [Planctomycetota bacterium]|tara:strand:+ start:176 stop:604 length:429 start_codon:yes stop_codon:yes gene_type:complete